MINIYFILNIYTLKIVQNIDKKRKFTIDKLILNNV
jgi:hypothetical protein